MKKYLSLIFIVLFGSCQSKETKFINAEFSKIQATWKIESFVVNAPDSLKNVLKKGEVVFNSPCKYDKKRFQNAESCGGDAQINELFYNLSYSYNATSKMYPLRFGPVGLSIIKPGTEQYNIWQLMNGDWELVATDNTLTAKQVKNTSSPNIQVSFTATRK